MRKSLGKMSIDELRDMAVQLGADRKKLYGTSKQTLIMKIHALELESAAFTPELGKQIYKELEEIRRETPEGSATV